MRLDESLVAVLLMMVSIGGESYASVADKTVTELAMSASDIAIVEIARRVPVEFEYGDKKMVCGYRVEARVIESFQGETRWIEFIDPLEGDPRESKSRYLLFAFEQVNKSEDREPATSFYEAESRCLISASKKLIYGQPRTLLRLVDTSESDGGWVLVPTGTALDTAALHHKPNSQGDGGGFVSWLDVRNEILSTLEAMRRIERGDRSEPR